jgi:hypothetical protein
MTALVEMEEFVDNCSRVFMERLGEFAQKKEMFDLGHWLQCYAVGSLKSPEASFSLIPCYRWVAFLLLPVHYLLSYFTWDFVGIRSLFRNQRFHIQMSDLASRVLAR